MKKRRGEQRSAHATPTRATAPAAMPVEIDNHHAIIISDDEASIADYAKRFFHGREPAHRRGSICYEYTHGDWCIWQCRAIIRHPHKLTNEERAQVATLMSKGFLDLADVPREHDSWRYKHYALAVKYPDDPPCPIDALFGNTETWNGSAWMPAVAAPNRTKRHVCIPTDLQEQIELQSNAPVPTIIGAKGAFELAKQISTAVKTVKYDTFRRQLDRHKAAPTPVKCGRSLRYHYKPLAAWILKTYGQ